MRPRTLARRLALQYLYMVDVGGRERVEPVAAFLDEHTDREEARAFAAELVDSVLSHREHLDQCIVAATEHWDLNRIAPVERNVLRIGCTELRSGNVPPKVALDEAVELGKRFGGRDSGGFVNGILERIRADLPARSEET